ncbi:MAG: DNA-directed RNA polymerase subunit alpha [Candidatus Omnitrophica bacterium]|nr:DNA-directed RNA polymerase subunit alpha [Candidatus Omnitrophota bacterium]
MKEFIYPSKFIWEKETYRENYGKLIIEPLERGYGVTIGNALRRVLLSSIPGIAITGLRVKGALHEYSTLEGMKEDLVEVVLNIKQIALKPIIKEYPHKVSVEIKDKDEICASDLINDGSIEVINKDLHIATIDPSKKYNFELDITEGFGYLPVEKMKLMLKDIPVGTILIDGLYSPVRKVTFHVENTRVAQFVDYEKLILEVWTTGAIEPKRSVEYACELLKKKFELIIENQMVGLEEEIIEKKEVKDELELIRITDLKLSTRIYNALENKNIKTLKDLLNVPKEKLEEMKNLGKKSIEEIEAALKKIGYSLKTMAELEEEKKEKK